MTSSYSLGEHFEQFVQQMIDSGRYASATEVMRDGLRLVEEREKLRADKLASLQSAIREGLESGASQPLDMDEVRAEARRRLVKAG